jgi:hypothetical protein
MHGNFEAIQNMSKTNLDATMKSFSVLSSSAQAITTEMTNFAKRSYENNTKAMEKLFGVKSLDKAVEVQSEYAKAIYEDCTAQVTKLGELYADLAKEAFKPYQDQVAKMSSPK